MAGHYAEDAVIRVVDRIHPPSRPLEVRGEQAIIAHLAEIYRRDMRHHLELEVDGEHRLSFQQACRYANGTRVLNATVLELEDGKITRQASMQ